MGRDNGKESILAGLSSLKVRANPDFKKIAPTGEIITWYKNKLQETVFGQERACFEVARALTRANGNLISPDRPVFVGMFLGSPGCGKTEMGRAIARTQDAKNPESKLLIIDCNTFQDDIDIHKITGSTPGYVGYGDKGIITQEFLAGPNVIVFDEIEKAHIKLHRLLLGIMDKGKLTMPVGTETYRNVKNVELNFAYSKILFTSNVGSAEIRDSQKKSRLGFPVSDLPVHQAETYKIGLKAMRERWKHMPEFLNRLDAVVVFDFLTEPVYRQILDKFIDECNEYQANGQNNPLAITDELREWLIQKTDRDYGGRELKRALEKYVLAPFAELKFGLDHELPVVADISDQGKTEFYISQRMQVEARNKAEEAERKRIQALSAPVKNPNQPLTNEPHDLTRWQNRWERRKYHKRHRRRHFGPFRRY